MESTVKSFTCNTDQIWSSVHGIHHWTNKIALGEAFNTALKINFMELNNIHTHTEKKKNSRTQKDRIE